MSGKPSGLDSDVKGIQFAMPPLQMSDAASIAREIMAGAADFCARKVGLQDRSPDAIVEAARLRGNGACEYLRHGIAVHLAEQLGLLDDGIRAVYLYEYEATSEDVTIDGAAPRLPVHLIVWVSHKTGALHSLVAALERALAATYAEMIGPDTLRHLLDVQIVDDAEVERQTGYGGLLQSVHQPPMRIWSR